jgi:hypothetical protein
VAGRNYTISKEEDTLIFRTPSFATGLDSVLHSGIYNREFASVLASAAGAGLVYVVVAVNLDNRFIHALVFLLVFAAGFPVFRKFVFKEALMEVIFNPAAGEATLYITRITRKLKEVIALDRIKGIGIESRRRQIENADAVEFVEKISLQHGTVIPGFGRETVLFLLKLKLTDGSERTIYSDNAMQDVIAAHDEIKEFLGLA